MAKEPQDEIVYSGWLLKRGNIRKSWKKRYCKLLERTITYAKDDKTKPLGIIELKDVLSIGASQGSSDDHHGFEMVTPGRIWAFSTDELECHDEWIRSLRKIINPDKFRLEIVKEGCLVKKGRVVKNWRTRHFVLVHGLLSYFLNEDQSETFKSIAGHSDDVFRECLSQSRGFIVLKQAFIRQEDPVDSHHHVFSITTKSSRTYLIGADSEGECNLWCAAVASQIGKSRNPSAIPRKLTTSRTLEEHKTEHERLSSIFSREDRDNIFEVTPSKEKYVEFLKIGNNQSATPHLYDLDGLKHTPSISKSLLSVPEGFVMVESLDSSSDDEYSTYKQRLSSPTPYKPRSSVKKKTVS